MKPFSRPTTPFTQLTDNTSRRRAWMPHLLGPLVLLALLGGHWAFAQSAPSSAPIQAVTQASPPADPVDIYGAWVLIPPLATIVLAIALRQVIPALAIGILIAAFMMVPCDPPTSYGGAQGIVWPLRLAVEKYLLGAFASLDDGAIDYSHLKIIAFTFMIGGMVGIIAVNGGTRAVVDVVARWASNRERGQIATWFAGLIVFFDDYANAMIVGPSMRPLTDRLRISRAKLAYIVDSTAAPVASIALIGTWVGAEISYIADGLDDLAQRPPFLAGVTAYGAFLASIPYRTYALLALAMVVLVGWLGRDFGPMRKAENAAAAEPDRDEPVNQPQSDVIAESTTAAQSAITPAGRAWYAIVPVCVLTFLTMGLLVATGWPAGGLTAIEADPDMPHWLTVTSHVLYNASANDAILYGALGALMAALLISLLTRSASLARCVDGATDVMSRMLPTMIILVLAWSLSAAMGDLKLGEVAKLMLIEHQFNPLWLPTAIFAASCVVSFATGTSWGTMGILCPAVVTVAAGLLTATGSDGRPLVPPDQMLPLFYASVGAVLAGAVFGDHCSPISDTTVLSSLASECSLEQHVWTQAPYALVVAFVSILCGDVLCQWGGQSVWVGLLAGIVTLWLIVLAFGRKPAITRPTA